MHHDTANTFIPITFANSGAITTVHVAGLPKRLQNLSLQQGQEIFAAAKVSLGALGPIVDLRLQAIPDDYKVTSQVRSEAHIARF